MYVYVFVECRLDGLFLVLVCFFFFFKQKTAYEMRISDWSSDVCSSDLIVDRRFFAARPAVPAWAKAYGDAFAPFDGPMDHWQETYWYAPANMLLDAGLVMPDAQRGTGIDIIGLNLMTPETETTTHYF